MDAIFRRNLCNEEVQHQRRLHIPETVVDVLQRWIGILKGIVRAHCAFQAHHTSISLVAERIIVADEIAYSNAIASCFAAVSRADTLLGRAK